MDKIILNGLHIPDELEGATEGSVTQNEILPVELHRIMGGFEENMLTKLGCQPLTAEEKHVDAA